MVSRALPFPFPFRAGTDICQISRIYSILCSPRGPRFVQRVFSPEERQPRHLIGPVAAILARASNSDPVRAANAHFASPSSGSSRHVPPAARNPQLWKAAEFVAGRFAAKEAAIKAHPHLRLSFHRIVIRRHQGPSAAPETADGPVASSGPPTVVVHGDGDAAPAQEAMLSISHDGDYATAVCLGFEAAKVPQVFTSAP